MDWQELTEADLISSLNSLEREGYTSATISKGEDPASFILTNVAHEARGYLAGNAENVGMPDGAKIPAEAKAHVLAIARHRLLSWADISVSADRVREFESAERFLKLCAEGKIKVTPHSLSTPEATEENRPQPQWSDNRETRFNRLSQEGI